MRKLTPDEIRSRLRRGGATKRMPRGRPYIPPINPRVTGFLKIPSLVQTRARTCRRKTNLGGIPRPYTRIDLHRSGSAWDAAGVWPKGIKTDLAKHTPIYLHKHYRIIGRAYYSINGQSETMIVWDKAINAVRIIRWSFPHPKDVWPHPPEWTVLFEFVIPHAEARIWQSSLLRLSTMTEADRANKTWCYVAELRSVNLLESQRYRFVNAYLGGKYYDMVRVYHRGQNKQWRPMPPHVYWRAGSEIGELLMQALTRVIDAQSGSKVEPDPDGPITNE